MHRLKHFLLTLGTGVAVVAAMAPAAALADEQALAIGDDVTAAQPAVAAQPARASQPGLFSRHSVPDDSLGAHRGGALTVVANDLTARGTVSDNFASNLSTGNNAITDSAFQHAAGLPMVIQNSGNNVLIQNSTILNLNLK